MKSKGTLKKIWAYASTVLVAIVVIIAVALVVLRLTGFQFYSILSGSMEPAYSVGDLIIVKPVSADEIEVGDAITFVLNEDLQVATHRVMAIDSENQHFYTKGDNNETADESPVHFKNLLGTPVFSVAMVGYFADWIQNPPGLYIALGIGAALMASVFLPDILRKKKDDKEKTVEKQRDIQ